MTEVHKRRPEVQAIIDSAVVCPTKGSYSVYTTYKNRLEFIKDLNSTEYEIACTEIAHALRV